MGRETKTRSLADCSWDLFLGLFGSHELLEHHRLMRSAYDRRLIADIERCRQCERRLRHGLNEWRFAGRENCRLFLLRSQFALLGFAEVFVEHQESRRDLLVQLESRANVFEAIVGDL